MTPSLRRPGSAGPWGLALSAAAWMAGSGLQMQQATLMADGLFKVVLSLALLSALGALALRVVKPAARAPRAMSALLWMIAVALLALCATEWRAASRLQQVLPAAHEGVDLRVQGVIVGLPRPGPQATHFEFEVERAWQGTQPLRLPPRLSLGWFTGWDGESLLAAPPQALQVGERWELTVRLKRPHGAFNPQGFDTELWLFERGIGATGSVRPGARRLAEGAAFGIDRLRQIARDAVLTRVDDTRAAGVLAALAVGDQAAIERDDWAVFRITGVAHLMSISGVHVTMLAWLAAAGLGRLWRCFPRAIRACPAPVAARWGGVIVAVLYALLAGWGVPAQRTVLMLAVAAALRSLALRWPWPLVWLAAGWAVSVLDPWALLQPGFWLSFVAVGLLMASEPARAQDGPAAQGRVGRVGAFLGGALRSQAVATVGLAPLSMLFFQQVSLVGVFANLVAIPWVTLVVTPLALLGLVVQPLWQLGAWAVQALMALLALLASWPHAQWTAAAAGGPAQLLGLLGGALLVLPLPLRLRLLGLPMLLMLFWPAVPRPPHGQVEIVVADVGQGTAVLVRTRSHLLLYDAGPRYSLQSDAGARVLLPLLRSRGEAAIDRLVLSHRDTDHTGGAPSLLAGIPVRSVLSSLEDEHPLRPRLPQHQRCLAGQHWQWDGVRFEVLHPMAGDEQRGLRPNALSCVLRVVDAQGPRLLLTGDIEVAQEAELLARQPRPDGLRADLLLLPHHGSATSSTAELLRAVKPDLALAQAGYRNRFGHPAPPVVQRLNEAGIPLIRTDRCGAWQWPGPWREAGGISAGPRGGPAGPPGPAAQGFEPYDRVPKAHPGICEREERRRYWHHAGAP
ncbi:MAG: DNA internalization-related competence protein ComEC/Rec2 [Rubrivivax sp.]|nr:DNA internalization-related competence protein ComEC/Rec2 [Rubrivivax sp.]